MVVTGKYLVKHLPLVSWKIEDIYGNCSIGQESFDSIRWLLLVTFDKILKRKNSAQKEIGKQFVNRL